MISEEELAKHKKVTDILGFIKAGNLSMVHGLNNYHKLGQSVILLKGFGEDFSMSKTEKLSMADWNPLLLAVAFKKLDIVKYFLHDLLIPLRLAGSKTFNFADHTEDQIVAD